MLQLLHWLTSRAGISISGFVLFETEQSRAPAPFATSGAGTSVAEGTSRKSAVALVVLERTHIEISSSAPCACYAHARLKRAMATPIYAGRDGP